MTDYILQIKTYSDLSEFDKYLKSIAEDRCFRVSDTKLTYRQINSLESSGLLPASREDTKGWRDFSYRDMVFLKIIVECRKFGLENTQLVNLKNLFYKTKIKNINKKIKSSLTVGDYCFYLAIANKQQIKIGISATGDVVFAERSEPKFTRVESKSVNSYLSINFNHIVNELLENVQLKDGAVQYPNFMNVIRMYS